MVLSLIADDLSSARDSASLFAGAGSDFDDVSLTETTRTSGPEFPRPVTADVVKALRADFDFPPAWIPVTSGRKR